MPPEYKYKNGVKNYDERNECDSILSRRHSINIHEAKPKEKNTSQFIKCFIQPFAMLHHTKSTASNSRNKNKKNIY